MKNKPKQGRISPLRRCVGCREMLAKTEMLRIVRQGGEFLIDASGKAQGRGAYVCGGCIPKAAKTRAFDRSFKTKIPAAIYEELAKNG